MTDSAASSGWVTDAPGLTWVAPTDVTSGNLFVSLLPLEGVLHFVEWRSTYKDMCLGRMG